ncbi:uncharacterized protein [Phaenicophaeus curvirostris]|uniref:uncharacterized protein n=1 Tax=Phaenicophaeus curvirostris TaxID=33595 RepID=UPI0037F09642
MACREGLKSLSPSTPWRLPPPGFLPPASSPRWLSRSSLGARRPISGGSAAGGGIPALGENGGTQCCRAVAAERYCSRGRGNGTAPRGGRGGERRAGRGAGRFAERLGSARLLSAPRGAVRDGSALLFAALPPAAGCGQRGAGWGRDSAPRAPMSPPGRERLERGRVGRKSLTTDDERAPAGSRPLPRARGEATWRCPPGQQRSAALKRGSQSQPRKRQRQLCRAGWVSKLYKRGCGSGMISVKSTTSKRASRLPGGSLQCPRQRAHLQTGSCGKPGARINTAA